MKNKKALVLVIAVVLVILLAAVIIMSQPLSVAPNYAPSSGQVSASIAAFETVDLDGNAVTDTVFAGHQLTMVNIWSTTCSPCLKEMPFLQELGEELAEEGFQIIGIVDDAVDIGSVTVNEATLELAQRICDQTGVEYPNLVPDASLKNGILNGLAGYPTTYFVAADGTIVGERYFGARTKEEWKDIITTLLEGA